MDKPIYSQRSRELAELLKALRESRKMSQRTVAQRLGKSQSYVQKYECGQSQVTLTKFWRIAPAVGTPALDVARLFVLSPLEWRERLAFSPGRTASESDMSATEDLPTVPDEESCAPIAERLRSLLRKMRKQAGLNETELGELLDDEQSFVSKYELGYRELDVVEIEQIASLLGADLLEVLSEVFEDL